MNFTIIKQAITILFQFTPPPPAQKKKIVNS